MRAKPGFTLPELLVAIAIIGMLLALALVGIQTAREAARRAQCANNLRQVGLGFQNYAASLGSLPPAVIWAPFGEPLGDGALPIGVIDRVARYGRLTDDTIYGNWAILLLPYLEQAPLYQSFDPRVPISDPNNAIVRETDIATLKCPSDSFNQVPFSRGLAAGLEGHEYARGNYALNVGPDKDCVQGLRSDVRCVGGFFVSGRDLLRDNDAAWGSGLGGVNKSFRFNDVRDGLSNTIVIDEIRAGVDPLDPRGVWALGQIGSSAVARHGKLGDGGGPNYGGAGSEEFIGCDSLIAQLGGSTLSAMGMPCQGNYLQTESNTQAGARSIHRGGVNCGFCDGSVHFIANDVAIDVWHAMHTRDRQDSFESPF